MEIVLPWFDPILNPNTRWVRNQNGKKCSVHWAKKSKARAKQKHDAYWLTMKLLDSSLLLEEYLILDITFHPPSNRRMDLDNALAALKGAIDGIAEAIKIDDSNFKYILSFGEKVKYGIIIIKVTKYD